VDVHLGHTNIILAKYY